MNMIETKCNYKGQYKNNLKCEMCFEEDDTTEHLLLCKRSQPTCTKIDDIKRCNPAIVAEINNIISKRVKCGKIVEIRMENDSDDSE